MVGYDGYDVKDKVGGAEVGYDKKFGTRLTNLKSRYNIQT